MKDFSVHTSFTHITYSNDVRGNRNEFLPELTGLMALDAPEFFIFHFGYKIRFIKVSFTMYCSVKSVIEVVYYESAFL